MHSYQFSWSKIGSNIYVSYAFAAMGEVIVFLTTVPICNFLGRKNTMVYLLTSTIICNLVAMINVKIYKEWNLEFTGSILASMSINAAFSMMYLITIERTPTSHSGLVISLGNAMSRLGGIAGPQLILLYNVTTSRGPLAIYAGMALLSLSGILMLPDTTGKSIPEIPTAREAGKIGCCHDTIKEIEEEENDTIYENPGATTNTVKT